MPNVSFKKGLLANLPAAHAAGTFYVTTDERALYLDVDETTRVRIGDFQEYPTLAALQANGNPSTTALYYVTDLNCLAKWDGTKYVQINLDTGATSAEVVGSGNAVTKVSYDPNTRKLTLTADATYTTADDVDKQIADKVGDLKMGDESFETVKAYVDKKTDGIATDAALESLTGRVTATEDSVNKLESKIGEVTEGSTVVQMIDEAKKEATYDDTELKGKVNTLVGDDANKSARTIANEELAKQLIPENAKESLDTLAEIASWIQAHPDDATAMNKAISDLASLVGTLPEDAESASVVAYIREYADAAIAALKIGDYAKAADLAAAVTRISALEDDNHTHENKAVLDGITDEKVSAWNSAEKNANDYTDTSIDSALSWGSF